MEDKVTRAGGLKVRMEFGRRVQAHAALEVGLNERTQ
jgi:hypothetical protein